MNCPSRLIEYSRQTILFIYRWLLKLKINSHQLIAYFRSRVRQADNLNERQRIFSLTEVNVGQIKDPYGLSDRVVASATAPIRIEPHANDLSYQSTSLNSSQQSKVSNYTKTPRLHRSRIFSFLRRLSPRNFMDYCVIALNEASGSASSNKFDLSSCNSYIWLLGRKYNMPDDGERLIDDVRTRLWITYRKNFPPIDENTRYTTDRGFGCMIRCGQMVLANALLYKHLGRDWRWSPKGIDLNPPVYNKILRLFQDREDYHYSIHRIVKTGLDEGKSIGEWFGPNTIAQALKRLSTHYMSSVELDESEILMSIDAALDNMVVIDEIKSRFRRRIKLKNGTVKEQECTKTLKETVYDGASTNEIVWNPGILFIQLRLGLTKINPIYFAALKKTFHFKNSLGIIGGRPNHALYLVGYTDDDIIYLDPHSTQQYIDFDELDRKKQQQENDHDHLQQQVYDQSDLDNQYVDDLSPDSTYHCSRPEKMSIERLDPSLALCFYFDTEKEFDNWCNSSEELLIKSEQAPMFEITHSRPTDWNVSLTTRTISKSSSDQEEEFEILS